MSKEEKKKKEPEIPYWLELLDIIEDSFQYVTLVGVEGNKTKKLMLRNSNFFSFDLRKLIKIIKESLEIANHETKIKSYTHSKKEVLAYLCDSNQVITSDFHDTGWIIPFNNGVYDCEKNIFYAYSDIDAITWKGEMQVISNLYKIGDDCLDFNDSRLKDKYFFNQIPYNFIPNFKYDEKIETEFDKGLKAWIGGNFSITDIYEIIGYLLTLQNGLKRAFLIYGPPNSGKTQFGNIIISLFHPTNILNIPLQDLNRRFARANLLFKTLNYVLDLPRVDLKEIGPFKNLTGDDIYVNSEIKFGGWLKWRNTTRFCFNANYVPKVDKIDEAFFDRFILIPFPNKFPKNPNWHNKIIGNELEIQIIIHKSIIALKNLISRFDFRKEICKDSKETWLKESDSLYKFMKEGCLEGPDYREECKVFTEEYWNFCKENDIDMPSKGMITRNLEKYGKKKIRDQSYRKERWIYTKIKLKE